MKPSIHAVYAAVQCHEILFKIKPNIHAVYATVQRHEILFKIESNIHAVYAKQRYEIIFKIKPIKPKCIIALIYLLWGRMKPANFAYDSSCSIIPLHFIFSTFNIFNHSLCQQEERSIFYCLLFGGQHEAGQFSLWRIAQLSSFNSLF
jgi:ribosomal protein L31